MRKVVSKGDRSGYRPGGFPKQRSPNRRMHHARLLDLGLKRGVLLQPASPSRLADRAWGNVGLAMLPEPQCATGSGSMLSFCHHSGHHSTDEARDDGCGKPSVRGFAAVRWTIPFAFLVPGGRAPHVFSRGGSKGWHRHVGSSRALRPQASLSLIRCP